MPNNGVGSITITPFSSAGEGRTFNFIDAMPGAGKTEYFVECATRHLRKSDTSALILYVAPTVQLLMEAQRRIFAKIPENLRLRTAIVVASRTEEMADPKNAELNIKVERPANAANRLLQLITDEEYAQMPQSSGQKLNFVKADVTRIKVLMITHEAFVRIRYASKEIMSKSRLPLTHVMFDEARQCITKGQVLGQRAWGGADPSVSGHEIESLQKILTFHRTSDISTDANGRKTAFFNVSGMCLDKKSIALAFRVERYLQISKPMREFLAELRETCAEGRNLMTVLLKVKSTGKPDLSDSGFTPFTVLRPTELFSGYARVTLMSALFRDSQMWHILTNYNGNKHTMEDLLDDYYTKRDRSLRNIKQRHLKNKEMLPKRLVCIPLTTSSRGALSTNQLNNSCILPKELDARISELAEENPNRTRADMISFVLSGGVLFNDVELTQKLRIYLAPPLWVMIRESYHALKKAGCTKALLFINSKSQHRVWEPARIDYIHLIRDALRYNTDDTDEYDAQHLTAAEARQTKLVDKRWFEFIKEAVHGKKKFFITPRTTSVRGLNEYKDHVGYVHLAALNQENIMYTFFGHIMPEYDVDLDNVVDNVLQTLYRTNLREPDSDSKIYMVVSNEYAITKLAEKVFRREDQSFKTLPGYIPRLTNMTYRGKGGHKTKESHLAASSKGGKSNRKYTAEMGKELHKAKAGLRQALKAKNPRKETVEGWRTRILQLETEIKTEKHLKEVAKLLQ